MTQEAKRAPRLAPEGEPDLNFSPLGADTVLGFVRIAPFSYPRSGAEQSDEWIGSLAMARGKLPWRRTQPLRNAGQE